MARTVEPGFHWIQECGPDRLGSGSDEGGQEVHVPQNAYLLDGDESLLFDTLSPAATDQVLEEIDEALDGTLDYLVPSHPDVPHAGNTRAILDEHEATLVAPKYGKAHELYHLGDARKVGEGDTIDLGGFVVEFHEAAFPDSAVHMWMSERTTETLFTVDWLGFPHTDDECHEFVDEMSDGDGVETWRLVTLHDFVLFWLKYVDVETTNAEIDALVERHDPSIVAPAHGLVIREEPKEHMLRMKEVVERISEAS